MSSCTRSHIVVTWAFLPLLRQARGRIVMIGSIGARFTPPFVGALAASKSALAAALPTAVLDMLRRMQAHQPAPGSRLPSPHPAAHSVALSRSGTTVLQHRF